MTLKERWHAKESELGAILKNVVAKALAITTILGGAVDVTVGLPQEWVPMWVKTTIVISALVSYVSGKLTVKK